MLNFNHLYYFYLSHRLGGVTKAAQHLHVSQSSLSVQIKDLEEYFNSKLFYKSGRKLFLTDEGQKIYTFADSIFTTTDQFLHSWENLQSTIKRKVIIGVSPQVERPFAASLLSPIMQSVYKTTLIEIVSGTDQELNSKLDTGAIDLLLTNNSIYKDSIIKITTLDMPVKLYVARQVFQKLKLSSKFKIKEIFDKIDTPFILPSESFLIRHEIDLYLRSIQTENSSSLISDILSVIERAIVEGGGFAFMPENYIQMAVDQKLAVGLGPDKGLWTHQIALYCRKEFENAVVTEKVKSALEGQQLLEKKKASY